MMTVDVCRRQLPLTIDRYDMDCLTPCLFEQHKNISNTFQCCRTPGYVVSNKCLQEIQIMRSSRCRLTVFANLPDKRSDCNKSFIFQEMNKNISRNVLKYFCSYVAKGLKRAEQITRTR